MASPTSVHERLAALPQNVLLVRRTVSDVAVGYDAPASVRGQAEICDGMLQVTVCDHGIGVRPRIDSPGLGLGLGLIAHVGDSLEPAEIEPGVRVCMTFAID